MKKSTKKPATKPEAKKETPKPTSDELLTQFHDFHKKTPIIFRETVRDHARYNACVNAKTFTEALKHFKDEKDLQTFIRWCVRGAPGYKPSS
jgi:hypothetical protein